MANFVTWLAYLNTNEKSPKLQEILFQSIYKQCKISIAFLETDSELRAAKLKRKCAKSCFFSQIGFYQITRFLSILGHMLLHKLYINVAIANNLLYRFTLSDLPEPKNENLKCRFVEKRFLSNNSSSVHFRPYFRPCFQFLNLRIEFTSKLHHALECSVCGMINPC